jgi:hypothetical protein
MLQEFGYVVISCIANTEQLRNEFKQTCVAFPEYKTHDPGGLYVLGGFAALGNPASFHNPFVRRLREMCMAEILIRGVIPKPSDDHKIEHIIDRMMLRRNGLGPSAESWHRDEAVGTLSDDVVYGGWINLDDKEQYFSCVPKTHRNTKNDHGGFAKISKDDIQKYKHDKSKITVPPGSILIFNEDIIHEVLPTASKIDSYRLFLSWRVTTSDKPLILNLDSIIETQGVVPLKSGQIPAMYSKLHWTNWWEKLKIFSGTFKDICLCDITVKAGKNMGEIRRLVYRHMPSLMVLKLPMYPVYTDHEKQMLHPNNEFLLRAPGSTILSAYIY